MAGYVAIVADGDQGRPVLVEIDGEVDEKPTGGSGGLVDVGRTDQVVTRVTESLGHLTERIRPVADGVARMFRETPDPPDEVQIQFGISLNSEADVVVSRASAGANFQVTLTWRTEPSGPDGSLGEESDR